MNTSALLALKLMAALAAKLADDYERNRIYPGQLTEGLNEIGRALDDARQREQR